MTKPTVFLLLFLCSATTSMADTLIVVNKENETTALTRGQIVDLYMGRYNTFPNNEAAFPLDQPADSEIRAEFYKKLTKKRVAEINAYWARLLFSGRATPPRVLPDSSAVKKAVSMNKGAIGYIDSAELDESVKVVGRVE